MRHITEELPFFDVRQFSLGARYTPAKPSQQMQMLPESERSCSALEAPPELRESPVGVSEEPAKGYRATRKQEWCSLEGVGGGPPQQNIAFRILPYNPSGNSDALNPHRVVSNRSPPGTSPTQKEGLKSPSHLPQKSTSENNPMELRNH
jgi:hypothetical protein